jgi:hypothetical protein
MTTRSSVAEPIVPGSDSFTVFVNGSPTATFPFSETDEAIGLVIDLPSTTIDLVEADGSLSDRLTIGASQVTIMSDPSGSPLPRRPGAFPVFGLIPGAPAESFFPFRWLGKSDENGPGGEPPVGDSDSFITITPMGSSVGTLPEGIDDTVPIMLPALFFDVLESPDPNGPVSDYVDLSATTFRFWSDGASSSPPQHGDQFFQFPEPQGIQYELFFSSDSAVPEPGTVALVGSGFLILLAHRWRKAG